MTHEVNTALERVPAATTWDAPKEETLAIIPARGGSKGIPRKNIALLGGKPLIAYSIEAALRCPGVTRVVVSTEDEEIAEIARHWGAEVPFLRPRALAGDGSDLSKSFQHIHDRLKEQGYVPDYVVHLLPTSPFRPPWLMDELTARLHRGHALVHTVRSFPSGRRYFVKDENGSVRPIDLQWKAESCFRSYGIFTGHAVTRPRLPNSVMFVDDPVLCIDIDTPADFRLAQEALDMGLFPREF
ncbi:acylneuraminate cytidylyltransferase [Desulfovibrio sp. X2]|uniref:acylneuraminate cytidylyltransferase family protein n=1 Tax=Desulfovibrio sp. X2 TaxID=941449 RepID=UPI000358AE5B|nr:acylneuraminate cytidylyltransferase family protein [Desulfovibrio sp. X2]EPR37189.1 acylneuraminate cytidylyltransferase [Desulfovibrio sp. X2]